MCANSHSSVNIPVCHENSRTSDTFFIRLMHLCAGHKHRTRCCARGGSDRHALCQRVTSAAVCGSQPVTPGHPQTLRMKFSHATVVCAKGETIIFIAAEIQSESDNFLLVSECIASNALKVTKLRLQIFPIFSNFRFSHWKPNLYGNKNTKNMEIQWEITFHL